MPDNDESNNSSNDSSNNSSTYSGGGKKIVLGADGGCSQEDCDKIRKGLEDCGNTVEFTCIGPNQEAYMRGKGADIGVFFVNGVAPATIWSFVTSIKAGQNPFTIFALPGWAPYHDPNEPEGTLASLENARAYDFKNEWDAAQFMSAADTARMQEDGNGATTLGEYVDANSQYCALCWGASAEELAQNICNGSCGGGGSVGGGNSSGGAQIKDKTFEKCIRRICAATDSIFIVESNAAVLFPYVDWMAFTLRQKINTIKADEIDPDIFTMEYGNDGFYNKVTIAWGGATLPERYPKNEDGTPKDVKRVTNYTSEDILKNMRLTNFNYENFQKEQETIKSLKEKTDDIVTKKGDTTQTISIDESGTTLLSEQYDAFVEKYGELEKRVESAAPDYETAQYIINALLIQYIRDYNNMCKCRALSDRKYIGGTFYSVENPFTKESELFYLNGYTIRMQKGEPMYHDLDFRYGPEGAEELLDYQTLSGGAATGGGATTGGSATEQEIWERAKVPCHQWTCGDLRVSESDTQDPQVAEDYYNKMADSGKKFCLTCYGMSAFLHYEFNQKAGIACQVVGNSQHHVVMLDRGDGKGFVETRQEYRQLEEGYRWMDSQDTTVLLPATAGGSNNTSSSGNTNKTNANGGNR